MLHYCIKVLFDASQRPATKQLRYNEGKENSEINESLRVEKIAPATEHVARSQEVQCSVSFSFNVTYMTRFSCCR